jgi:hypothetical protein
MTSCHGPAKLALMLGLLQVAEARLSRLLGLSSPLARRAVAEVVDCFDCDVDEFITAAHQQLKREGLDNDAIYERIAAELPRLRFRGPALSARQVRRRIYG